MRLTYIEDSKIDIDYYLLISMHSQSNTMTLFEDEEELVMNCVSINQSTYIDYFREVRDTIISVLIETTVKIIQCLTIQPIVNTIPNQTVRKTTASQTDYTP